MNSIFALCSGYGRAGVAVFRISGLDAKKVIEDLTKLKFKDVKPRYMHYCQLFEPKEASNPRRVIDQVMIVYFKSESSFTGEDVLEIHTHGSIAVLNMVNDALNKLPYLRLAEAGEFARRAFLNGKFDLTGAEGLADLIDAQTELQQQQAIRQLGGGLAEIYENWRQKLLTISAQLEAYIDFPDEEIPLSVLHSTENLVKELSDKIRKHLQDNKRGELLRNGIKLAIIGAPNAGKSSMLNFLMQRNVAIVSDIAGTTRDLIEGHLDIGGYPIILQDTAGIREGSDDVIENQGIEIAKIAAQNADIKLFIIDANAWQAELPIIENFVDEQSIICLNKSDLVEDIEKIEQELCKNYKIHICAISLKEKSRLADILQAIEVQASNLARPSDSPQITRKRHRDMLTKALSSLEQFSLENDLVLATEDLRMTVRYISNITGKITVDEILGEIFANFCIGK